MYRRKTPKRPHRYIRKTGQIAKALRRSARRVSEDPRRLPLPLRPDGTLTSGILATPRRCELPDAQACVESLERVSAYMRLTKSRT